MSIMRKLFFRKLSEENYKRLLEIKKKETNAMGNHLQYVLILFFWCLVLFYFAYRTTSSLPLTPYSGFIPSKSVVVFGSAILILILMIIKKYIFKSKLSNNDINLLFSSILIYTLLSYKSGAFNIEYLIYYIVTFCGISFIIDFIINYFCLRLLEEKKKKSEEGGAIVK